MRMLFLDLDALSPEHMSCYGYHRSTTPNIDRIAEEGIRFNNYYTSDAPCAPSRTALMTGQFGLVNGLVNHGGAAGDLRQEGKSRELMGRLSTGGALPSYLQLAADLHTVLISPFAQRHSTFSFYAGFNEIINTGKYGNESAEDVTPTALDWISRNAKKEDWFLYINYWDAHTPYRAPESFGNPFEQEPLPEWLTDEVLEQHKQKVGSHSVHELTINFREKKYTNETSPSFPRHPGDILNRDSLRQMIDGYDCGIRYMDEQLGLLFKALEEQGVWDELMIVISADHGENMGQLGLYGEHATADQATCRLPMIIRWPGMKQGHVDEGLHYHLDLLPTLADMLELPPVPEWNGISYAPALRGGAECGREYLVVSQCAHVVQRSVRFGDWLYIRTYHDGFHLFDKEMLFNVAEDPYEQHNVAARHRELCLQAVYYLNEWHDETMRKAGDAADPLWTVIHEGGPFHARGYLPGYVQRLEETGRGEHIEELVRRHPQEFPSQPHPVHAMLRGKLSGKMSKGT